MINEKNALIESLWQKAYDNLQERYGVNPDLRILNRFYSEKMALRKSDSIILWDLALKIKNKATTSGQTLTIHGGIQSSFSGHLLAATDTNPLPLHYFCPKCKGTEFIDKKMLPWDLPNKDCQCGGVMYADGFDIPFNPYLTNKYRFLPYIASPASYVNEIQSIVKECIGDMFRICTILKPRFSHIQFVFLEQNGKPDYEEKEECAEDKYKGFPTLAIGYGRSLIASKISKATGVDFYRLAYSKGGECFSDPRILDEFAKGNIGGILGFYGKRHPYASLLADQIIAAAPGSSYDLVKYIASMQGMHNWWNNAEFLIKNSICKISDIPTQKEDVYSMIRDKLVGIGLTEFGIASNITLNIGYSRIFNRGLNDEEISVLEKLNLPNWFMPYIEKLQYLTPKADNIDRVRFALTYMWYKLNYPEEFDACVDPILKDNN